MKVKARLDLPEVKSGTQDTGKISCYFTDNGDLVLDHGGGDWWIAAPHMATFLKWARENAEEDYEDA